MITSKIRWLVAGPVVIMYFSRTDPDHHTNHCGQSVIDSHLSSISQSHSFINKQSNKAS